MNNNKKNYFHRVIGLFIFSFLKILYNKTTTEKSIYTSFLFIECLQNSLLQEKRIYVHFEEKKYLNSKFNFVLLKEICLVKINNSFFFVQKIRY